MASVFTRRASGRLVAGLALLSLASQADAARRFTELGAGRGLDANVAVSMLVDRDGLLWVGSREGLFRYDGYQATAFLPDPDRPGSISDQDVRALYESDDGALWVSTNTGGLNRRDPRTGKFTQFHHDSSDPRSLTDESIYGVAEDADGRIWVGTQNGLNRLDADGRGFVQFFHESADANSLAHNWAYALHRGASRRLWIGTVGGGLDRWDGAGGKFEHFPLAQLAGGARGLDDVFSIHEAADGRVWAGTREGLVVLDPARRTATAHRHGERRGDAAAHHDAACGSLRPTMGRHAGPRRAGRRPHDRRVDARASWQRRRPGQPAGAAAAEPCDHRPHAVRRHVGQRCLPGAARGAGVPVAGAGRRRRRAPRQEHHGGARPGGGRTALGRQLRRRPATGGRRGRFRRPDRRVADRFDPAGRRAELRRDPGRLPVCRVDRGRLPVRRGRQQPRPRGVRRGPLRRHRRGLRRRAVAGRRGRTVGRRRRRRPVPARRRQRALSRLPARSGRAGFVERRLRHRPGPRKERPPLGRHALERSQSLSHRALVMRALRRSQRRRAQPAAPPRDRAAARPGRRALGSHRRRRPAPRTGRRRWPRDPLRALGHRTRPAERRDHGRRGRRRRLAVAQYAPRPLAPRPRDGPGREPRRPVRIAGQSFQHRRVLGRHGLRVLRLGGRTGQHSEGHRAAHPPSLAGPHHGHRAAGGRRQPGAVAWGTARRLPAENRRRARD